MMPVRRIKRLSGSPRITIRDAPGEMGRHFLEETTKYRQEWARSLGIPYEWQEEVIRAAITLKLNAYDATGAIVAAMTTSIPEAADSGRNWGYRYCWLREGYFVVNALNRLGAIRTMERYLAYIVNIAANAGSHALQSVYGIDGRSELEEREVRGLAGYRGMGPVRFGNRACRQVSAAIRLSVRWDQTFSAGAAAAPGWRNACRHFATPVPRGW